MKTSDRPTKMILERPLPVNKQGRWTRSLSGFPNRADLVPARHPYNSLNA
jgi:hypothetical protein